MYVRNLSGEDFAIQADSTHKSELNGMHEISLTVLPTKVNELFIDVIAEMWELFDDNDVAYKIVYAKRRGQGNRLTVDIRAKQAFFDDMDTSRIYERYDRSLTANACFTLIFDGSGYNFVLGGTFYAKDWEGLGEGETRLEMFKRAIERYGAEFYLVGNTVHLVNLIERNAQFHYRHRLNASNIVQEIDATAFYTYAKGFGDFADGEEQDAALIREYTSPLASLAAIGIREAPPIYDGRVTQASTMDASLKALVDESLKVSISTDIVDLRKQGYPLAQPELGDRIILIDERIGLDVDVRVLAMEVQRRYNGDIKQLKLTIGSEGVLKRHKSTLATATKRLNDLYEGRAKLPFSVLDNAVAEATKALQAAQTELSFSENGILAVSKTNPNHVVLMNSAGVGVSTDGGATFNQAMTGAGINASVLTAGSVFTNNVSIIGDSNYFYWDGSGLNAINPNDVTKYVRLDSSGLYIAKGAMTIERPDGFKVINNGILSGNYAVQSANPPFRDALNTEVVGRWFKVSSSEQRSFDKYTFSHLGRYLRIDLVRYVEPGGNAQGIIYAEDNTTGEDLWSISFDNDSNHDAAIYPISYNIDIGVPTGNTKAIIIRTRTTNNNYPVYLNVGRVSVWG